MSETRWVEPLAPGARRPARVFSLEAEGGVRLRAAIWEGTGRGLAILCPGRAEYLEKAAITAAPLVARGFTVAGLDWRGQGRSERFAIPAQKGHVDDFDDYLADLSALLAAPELAREGPVRLVAAHSMGGAVAVLAAGRGLVEAPLVLSAPMFGISVAPVERRIAQVLGWIAHQGGRTDLWPPVPKAARPYPLYTRFEHNLLTHARDVWDWMCEVLERNPAIGIGLPTFGWLLAAERAMRRLSEQGPIGQPGVVILGSGERVVCPAALEAGCARFGFTLARVEGALHEPFIEAEAPRAAAWAAVDRFLETARL